MTTKHNWTEEDDILVFYFYKFKGKEDIPYSREDVASLISNKDNFTSSFKKAIDNFKYLDTRKGLSNYAQHQKKTYENYKDKSKDELKSIVLKILDDKQKQQSIKP